jgi:signal transduction histidine kinase
LILRGANNTRRTVQCGLTPVLDPHGTQTNWAVNFHDITERRRLESELLEISDRERHRIGRDLHDGLGQQLTAIELMCQAIREDLAAGHPLLERQAAKMGGFLREAIAQTRALSHGLAPVKLEAAALMDALGELARTTGDVSKVKCRFCCAMPVLIADSVVSGHLYRIAQEAVNNALKHGQPGAIELELSTRVNAVRLRVSDDGRGLPNSRKSGTGMGLEVMKYRANLLGGTLAIVSEPGQGVTVDCTVPVRKS